MAEDKLEYLSQFSAYGPDSQGSIRGRRRNFPVCYHIQNGSGPHPAFC
jgi:hypothetical protein